MSNCAWMEWCAETSPGIATSETANNALMLTRIFAPEKKVRGRILHLRQDRDKSTVAAHGISWACGAHARNTAKNRRRLRSSCRGRELAPFRCGNKKARFA